MCKQNRYWFPAKRYGWGWGPPNCWQGWVVLLVWLIVIAIAARLLARAHTLAYLAFLIAMGGLLLVICYLKGEPPAWRWGDRK